MNGNGPVKVCFCSTHFDCDSKALQHFVGAQALHVQAHHLQDRRRTKYQLQEWQESKSCMQNFVSGDGGCDPIAANATVLRTQRDLTFSSLPTHTSFMMHRLFLVVMEWYIGVKEVL